jgi:hypothetical protein
VETSSKLRLFVAWLVLVAITVVYLGIDHSADDSGTPTASTIVTISAVALALVKVRVVIRELMDVRHAPSPRRRLTDLLAAVVGVSLLATYLFGQAVA